MKSLVTLTIALTATLAACNSDKKDGAPAPASGTASGSTGGAAPLPPPEPPKPTARITVTAATVELTKVLTPVGEGINVATMHGCREAVDRVAELFEATEESAVELRGWLADEALREDLLAVVKDRTDPALTAILAKIDAATGSCEGAVAEVRKGLDKLTTP